MIDTIRNVLPQNKAGLGEHIDTELVLSILNQN